MKEVMEVGDLVQLTGTSWQSDHIEDNLIGMIVLIECMILVSYDGGRILEPAFRDIDNDLETVELKKRLDSIIDYTATIVSKVVK